MQFSVEEPPPLGVSIETLNELLSPYDLEVQPGPKGALMIVRKPPRKIEPTPRPAHSRAASRPRPSPEPPKLTFSERIEVSSDRSLRLLDGERRVLDGNAAADLPGSQGSVFRVLDTPTAADESLLRDFAADKDVQVYLQPGGLDSVVLLYPDSPVDPLHYDHLVRVVTEAAVADWFAELHATRVQRFLLPKVGAMNFLLYDALAGGASQSLRLDTQGKLLGTSLEAMPIPAPERR